MYKANIYTNCLFRNSGYLTQKTKNHQLPHTRNTDQQPTQSCDYLFVFPFVAFKFMHSPALIQLDLGIIPMSLIGEHRVWSIWTVNRSPMGQSSENSRKRSKSTTFQLTYILSGKIYVESENWRRAVTISKICNRDMNFTLKLPETFIRILILLRLYF